MADASAFDPALLDELARCFAEAAVRQLLASQPSATPSESTIEANSVLPFKKRSARTKRGPALLITEPSPPRGSAAEGVRSATCVGPLHVIPETGGAHGR